MNIYIYKLSYIGVGGWKSEVEVTHTTKYTKEEFEQVAIQAIAKSTMDVSERFLPQKQTLEALEKVGFKALQNEHRIEGVIHNESIETHRKI